MAAPKKLSPDAMKPTIGERFIGGLCGAFGGAIIFFILMILLYGSSNGTIWFGWLPNLIVGAVMGFACGAAIPEFGKALAYLISLVIPWP